MGEHLETRYLSELVGRIYDTSLNPNGWGEILLEISHLLGAKGAMIFEVLDDHGAPNIISPYHSLNFKKENIQNYLASFREEELKDQLEFARISSLNNKIELIDDTEFLHANFDRPNILAMQKGGLKHRSGTLLNKDSWNIDRFAVQYDKSRGPSTQEEKQKATLLLPHIAKALRIGRPLITHQDIQSKSLQQRIDSLNFGVAITTPNDDIILSNIEFNRICQDTNVFKINANGKLSIKKSGPYDRYRSLMELDHAHGINQANPRNEALLFPVNAQENARTIMVEICPANDHPSLGILPKGSRLITVFDSSVSHDVDTEIVSRFFPLSSSEQMVLKFIAAGHSNLEIADLRGRTVETINSQTKAILRKTYTRNRTELVQLSLSLKSPFSLEWLR